MGFRKQVKIIPDQLIRPEGLKIAVVDSQALFYRASAVGKQGAPLGKKNFIVGKVAPVKGNQSLRSRKILLRQQELEIARVDGPLPGVALNPGAVLLQRNAVIQHLRLDHLKGPLKCFPRLLVSYGSEPLRRARRHAAQ